MAKVCQALAYAQSSERIDEARALPYSCAIVSFTVAMALSCQIPVWAYHLR